MQWVGLLDCNNFFVSCERLFRPDLAKRPVVVLSSNDGCVVARSKEVKDMEIPMGVPYFKVKDTLNQANTAVFSGNFPLYRDISKRIFTVLKDTVAVVEQYSIDEAFFMLDDNQGSVVAQAAAIQHVVEARVGMPVSVGIAANKTIAKAANQVAKQGTGVFWYDAETWKVATITTPIGNIWGVGRGRIEQFRQHGIKTVADLLAADTGRVSKLFGVEGERLQAELSGRLVGLVRQRQVLQKSLMSTRSFQATTADQLVVEDALAYHLRRVAEDLRSMEAAARVLKIIIRPSRYSDFALQGGSAELVFATPCSDTAEFLRGGMKLLAQIYRANVPYKKAGVMVGGIVPVSEIQPDLFANTGDATAGTVATTLDYINQKYGLDTIGFGQRLKEKAWKSSRKHISTVSTTNWHNLPVVKAL